MRYVRPNGLRYLHVGNVWEQGKLEVTLREMLENVARRGAAVPPVGLAPPRRLLPGCLLIPVIVWDALLAHS